jgi:hypothetical protein
MLALQGTTPTTLSGAATPAPVRADRAPRGNGLMFAVLGGSVVVGVMIALLVARNDEPSAPMAASTEARNVEMTTMPAGAAAPAPPSEPAAAPAPVTDEPQAAPAADTEAATVTIHLVSTPEGAEVFRRAERLGTTPFDGTLPRGDTPVTLTVRKSGYKDRTITVTPTAAIDQKVELQLRPRSTRPSTRDKSVNPF